MKLSVWLEAINKVVADNPLLLDKEVFYQSEGGEAFYVVEYAPEVAWFDPHHNSNKSDCGDEEDFDGGDYPDAFEALLIN